MNTVQIVLIIGIIQGVFLVCALFFRKANFLANRIFALAILVITLFQVFGLLYTKGYHYSNPHMIGIMTPFNFLIGPLFYLYGLTLTRKMVHIEKKYLLHFIPFLAFVISKI
ncbi:MAG: hypothetical protein GY754_17650, partial [bacterium]|nr:hypothetical protein [bacterium]